MRVSPLKAGHSNRIEAGNNPINLIDPAGLKPGDFTDPISNAAYMNAGADAAVDRGDHFQAFLWRTGAILPEVIGASTAQMAGQRNGTGEAGLLENLYYGFVLGTAPFAHIGPKVNAAKVAAERAAMAPNWVLGSFKSMTKWKNQFKKRGWTAEQVTEALKSGKRCAADNKVNPGNPARRYTHPETGRSLVIDEATREILQVGGNGFVW